MADSIGIGGAAGMGRVLDDLPRKLSARLLTRALRKGANVLRKEARRRAPKRSGNLRRSIRIRISKAQRRGLAGAAGVQVYVSRGAFYGAFLEFGSARQPAHPFLRPAFDATDSAMVDAIGKQLGDDIEAVARALRKSFRIG